MGPEKRASIVTELDVLPTSSCGADLDPPLEGKAESHATRMTQLRKVVMCTNGEGMKSFIVDDPWATPHEVFTVTATNFGSRDVSQDKILRVVTDYFRRLLLLACASIQLAWMVA